MKPKPDPEVPELYPETPAWTMFFDGPLYQKYEEFMKGKDFSKILLSSKLKLANSQELDVKPEESPKRDEWWENEIDLDQDKVANPNIYTSVSEEYYRNLKDERQRIKRRTRAFILLGIVILAALAVGTALVIHYFFIPPDEDPSSDVNISLSENISATQTGILGVTSTVLPTKFDPDFSKDLNNLLSEFIPKDTGGDKTGGKLEPDVTISKVINHSSSISTTTATTEAPVTSFLDLYDFFAVDDFSTIFPSSLTTKQIDNDTKATDSVEDITTSTTKLKDNTTTHSITTNFTTGQITVTAVSDPKATHSDLTSKKLPETPTPRAQTESQPEKTMWFFDDFNTTTSRSSAASHIPSTPSVSTSLSDIYTTSGDVTTSGPRSETRPDKVVFKYASTTSIKSTETERHSSYATKTATIPQQTTSESQIPTLSTVEGTTNTPITTIRELETKPPTGVSETISTLREATTKQHRSPTKSIRTSSTKSAYEPDIQTGSPNTTTEFTSTTMLATTTTLSTLQTTVVPSTTITQSKSTASTQSSTTTATQSLTKTATQDQATTATQMPTTTTQLPTTTTQSSTITATPTPSPTRHSKTITITQSTPITSQPQRTTIKLPSTTTTQSPTTTATQSETTTTQLPTTTTAPPMPSTTPTIQTTLPESYSSDVPLGSNSSVSDQQNQTFSERQ